MFDIWTKRVKKSVECYEKVVLRIPMMYTRRHATAMSSITRTWFELWLDHSDSMTPTDLCRHLAASCPSFYLRPCYTTPNIVHHSRTNRLQVSTMWIVCYVCTCRKMYSRVYCVDTRLKDTPMHNVPQVALSYQQTCSTTMNAGFIRKHTYKRMQNFFKLLLLSFFNTTKPF
jgi:hypothetical protein